METTVVVWGNYQRWTRSRIQSPATFFGPGAESVFEFLEKNRIRIRYEWYGVYRIYVKTRQRWVQSRIRIRSLMLRLHMQVWQPGTDRKTCIKAFSCCQGHTIYSLWRG